MAEEKKMYEIIETVTTAYYHYLQADSREQAQQMWENGTLVKNGGTLPNAESSLQVDCQTDIYELKPEPAAAQRPKY